MKLGPSFHMLAGLWLMGAPAVAGYADAPAADLHRTIGPLVATFGTVALWAATRDVRWANLPLAAVLIAAPALGGHPPAAVLVGAVTGTVAAAVTPAGGPDRQARGRGWRGVVQPEREVRS